MDGVENIRAVTYLLIEASIGFVLLSVCLLLFIFFYLIFSKSKSQRNFKLANQFFTLVSEISLCESEDELQQVMAQSYVQEMQKNNLQKKRRRRFMSKALLQFHKTIHGTAADNIKWLYEQLGLKKDSIQQLASHRWHKKATAIQELAEMGQKDCITKLYRYTNHKNYYIRSEAQVAVVKLTGFDGLRFLNLIDQPLTQWQQLCLLQQLMFDTNIQEEKLQIWLQADNETVIEFALKLVKAFGVYSAHDALVNCLKHHNTIIRVEAITVLKDVSQKDTSQILKDHFTRAEKVEKLAILKTLQAIGTLDDMPFLQEQLYSLDTLLRNEVIKAIREINPDYCPEEKTSFQNDKINSKAAV